MRGLLVALLFLTTSGLADPIRVYVSDAGNKVFTNLGTRRAAEPVQGSAPASTASETDYSSLVSKYAEQSGIDENLVHAMIRVESNYDPNAVSPKGCKGLMQLHPDTARRFGVQDIFDPAENIQGGIKYLNFLMDYFKRDLKLVLAAYNAGENAVTRHQGIPPYRETRDYVKKITARYNPAPDNQTLAAAVSRQHQRIYRIVHPDGRVLFTNTPTEVGGN